VLPLVASPSHRRVVPAGCRIASCTPLIVPPSRCLVMPAGCCIVSCRPLVALPSHPLQAGRLPNRLSSSSRCATHSSCCRGGWLLRHLLTRRSLVVSLSRHATSRCLIAPVGCRIIISRRPFAAPSSRPLIVLAGCCVASPCAALLPVGGYIVA